VLLTITTTHRPATDLGYLLAKNPTRVQEFPLSFGRAVVFYPRATEDECTAALLVDVDPIDLVRGRLHGSGRGPRGNGFALAQYVNDRPYVASSFLSVAISRVLGSALAGRSKERPELAERAIPLVAELPTVPCRGGEDLLRGLFEPLGYDVETSRHSLDEERADWGESRYFTVRLRHTVRLRELLTHLYVLVPVLDDDKHYWVGVDEVEKLLAKGEGWLGDHPLRDTISRRFLKHQKRLTREALSRLTEEDEPDPDDAAVASDAAEAEIEKPIRLNDVRLDTVVDALVRSGATRVLDLGCGEGKLLQRLVRQRSFAEIVGVDVSCRALEIAAERLERLPDRKRRLVTLLHGSLMYRDRRLEGFDAAAVVEVIEHLDPPRLRAFERVLFEFLRPATIVVTTPNIEFNARFENLPAGKLRHRDHRFEWTRAEMRAWGERLAVEHGYEVEFAGIGEVDEELGTPTQMGVFRVRE